LSSGNPRVVRRLADDRNILDDVLEQADLLRSDLGAGDRDKLDECLTSVRQLEQRLVEGEARCKTPKPKADVLPPFPMPPTSSTARACCPN
jgi:hypothetical protein